MSSNDRVLFPQQYVLLSIVALLSPCIVRFAITLPAPCYNKSKLPPHTKCGVLCVSGNVCVTQRHIWTKVCLCVFVLRFLPFSSPSCVASHGLAIESLLFSHHPSDGLSKQKKRTRMEKEGSEGTREWLVRGRKSHTVACVIARFIQQKAAVGNSVPSMWPAGCVSISGGWREEISGGKEKGEAL